MENNHFETSSSVNHHQHHQQQQQHQHQQQFVIRIPYNWKRKILQKYQKIYYTTPSGHVLLTNSDVYKYLADPNTCKCSLDPSLTFDEVFNFDIKTSYPIINDLKSKTIESTCEQWFQSYFNTKNLQKFRLKLLDINQYLFCQYECNLYEMYKILNNFQQQNDQNIDNKSFMDWYQSMDWNIIIMLKNNGWLLKRNLNEMNLKHLAYEMHNIGIITDGNIDSNNLNNSFNNNDDENLNNLIEISEKIQNDQKQLEQEILMDDLNYFNNLSKSILLTDDNVNNDKIVKYLHQIIQSAKKLNFINNSLIFEFNDETPMIKWIIPVTIIELILNKKLDWKNVNLQWLKENFSIQNDDNNDNEIDPFDQIDPFSMLNINDDNDNSDDDESIYENNSNHNDMGSYIKTQHQQPEQHPEPQPQSISTIDIDGSCSSIPIEVIEDLDDVGDNSIMLATAEHQGLLMQTTTTTSMQDFEIRLDNDNPHLGYHVMNIPKHLLKLQNDDPQQQPNDDCNNDVIKEIVENSINQTTTDKNDDEYDDESDDDLLKPLSSSSSSSTTSSPLNQLKSREKYYQRLQRLKRQLEIQGMPGTVSTDEKIRLSPPLPPEERIFNVGDLCWGPFGDARLWPGKIISKNIDDINRLLINNENNVDQNQNNQNKVIVRWFGSNDKCTIVSSDNIRTLTEGLEAHHRARKRHRSGKPVNVLLERAIQEAMIELDNSINNSSN